jgi:acyl carrier protein
MLVLSLKNIQNKMTKEEIILKLTQIVKPYIHNEEGFKNLNEETDFIKDLDINSANLVDVILDVEDEFNIEIDNDSMEKMLSVKATIAIIQAKMNA